MTWMNVINHSYCLPHLHLSLCIVVMYYVNMVNHKVAPYIATGTQDSNWVSTIARIWILRSKILFLFFIADSFLLSLMLFSSKLCPGHLKWILHSRFKYELVCFQKRNCRTKSGRVTVVWICLTDTWLCVAVRGCAWQCVAGRSSATGTENDQEELWTRLLQGGDHVAVCIPPTSRSFVGERSWHVNTCSLLCTGQQAGGTCGRYCASQHHQDMRCVLCYSLLKMEWNHAERWICSQSGIWL